MLLKEDEVAPDLLELFGSDLMINLKQKVRQGLKIINNEFPLQIEYKIRDIIKKHDDRAIAAKKKSNIITQESNLCCTYIDALLRPLDESPGEDSFLVWSNVKVQEGCTERPDVSGMVLLDSRFDCPISVGKVKGEDRKEDTHALLCDLMKIACFSKEAIDKALFQGILGIHVVGFQVIFYVTTTLLAEGLYIMLEIASITLPKCLSQMKSFVADIEDILSIKDIYKECMKRKNDVLHLKKQGANYKTIRQLVKLGKDRKRHCTYVLNR